MTDKGNKRTSGFEVERGSTGEVPEAFDEERFAREQVKRDADRLLQQSIADSLRSSISTYRREGEDRADNNDRNSPNAQQLRRVRTLSERASAPGDYTLSYMAIALSGNRSLEVTQPLANPIARGGFGEQRGYAVYGTGTSARKTPRWHLGVDYETRRGPGTDVAGRQLSELGTYQPCYAIEAGTVARSDLSESYGYTIIIDHGGGVSSTYAHLSAQYVKRGDTVESGQVIGRTGLTEGRREGGRLVPHDGVKTPHIHFEIRINTGVFLGGPMEGTAAHPWNNVAIDPAPILAGRPGPLDDVFALPEDERKLLGAQELYAGLLSTAETEPDRAHAEAGYELTQYRLRALRLSLATRETHDEAEAQQAAGRKIRTQGG